MVDLPAVSAVAPLRGDGGVVVETVVVPRVQKVAYHQLLALDTRSGRSRIGGKKVMEAAGTVVVVLLDGSGGAIGKGASCVYDVDHSLFFVGRAEAATFFADGVERGSSGAVRILASFASDVDHPLFFVGRAEAATFFAGSVERRVER